MSPAASAVLAVAVVVLLVGAMLRTRANDEPVTAPNPADAPAAVTAGLTAVSVPAGVDNRMISYEGFEVGFNPSMHQPNYVAWELTPEKTDGPYSRKNAQFAADARVEGSATPDDYRRSGFDRGHIAPAADMKWSAQAMADCHLMTNITPQVNALNGGAWASVEKMGRRWANRFGRIIIVAGPVLSDRLTRTIGATGVAVPERFFKVVLAPDATPPMTIAFIMPNAYVEGGAQQAVATVDQVEAITGFDFFSALPDEIEEQIESHSALHQWNN